VNSGGTAVEALASGITVAQGGTGAVTLTDGGILLGSGTSAVTATARPATGEVLVGQASGDPALESGATLRTSLGLAIGSDVQAYSARLSEVAALAVTDGNVIVGDGASWVAESGATLRTSLGVPGLGANTFTGAQVFESTINVVDTIVVRTTDDGAGSGPDINIVRDSASPAANDVLGRILFYGDDSAANTTAYAFVNANILDPTDGSEDGRLSFNTVVAGTSAGRMYLAHGLFMDGATGGDKGAGTINAVGVYDDNSLLTDYVFDAAVEGSVDVQKWDGKVPNRQPPDRPVEARTHEPARRFSSRLDDLDPKTFGQKWAAARRLPAFEHKAGEQLSVGDYAQRLLETCEVQAVHIDKLLARIEALEAAVNGA
jgi:hypothetical protein